MKVLLLCVRDLKGILFTVLKEGLNGRVSSWRVYLRGGGSVFFSLVLFGGFFWSFFFEREGNGSPWASISQIKTHSWLVDDSSSGPPRPAVRNLLQVLALPWSVPYPVPATSLHTKH